jgi:hypothetical protein
MESNRNSTAALRAVVANLLRRQRSARATLRKLEARAVPECVLAEVRGGYFEAHNAAQATIQLINALSRRS